MSLRGLAMDPDPTITVSLDYLVEVSDDGKQPGQPEPEIIIPPPATPASGEKASGTGANGPA
jgi:hypothetical protein